MYEAAVFVIFPLCLVVAAFTDLFEMTVPNRIPAILLTSFILIAPFSGLSLPEFGWHILAGVTVFSVVFGLFAINVMGGGDAKLLTAAAVWYGFTTSLLHFLIYVAYGGGLLTLLILLVRSNSNTVMALNLPVPHSILTAKKIPYAIAICVGGLAAFPQSPLVLAALEQIR
ncbi:peptidase [Rhizobium daejeonense]|uniref:Peptidase n=1 Tax=Rhizobium daejeonense TaxID=240521 RepID=A0A6M1S6Q3_9HYPH|nr:prepilin peptidase [Rhizobium daejeonense]NGO64987.1 peptidase [Rhizobium daejeonense]